MSRTIACISLTTYSNCTYISFDKFSPMFFCHSAVVCHDNSISLSCIVPYTFCRCAMHVCACKSAIMSPATILPLPQFSKHHLSTAQENIVALNLIIFQLFHRSKISLGHSFDGFMAQRWWTGQCMPSETLKVEAKPHHSSTTHTQVAHISYSIAYFLGCTYKARDTVINSYFMRQKIDIFPYCFLDIFFLEFEPAEAENTDGNEQGEKNGKTSTHSMFLPPSNTHKC